MPKKKKRVRWADIEAAKDAQFQRDVGFQLLGTEPLKRQRIRSPPRMRSPPPDERAASEA